MRTENGMEDRNKRSVIRSFHDLEVYKRLYKLMLSVMQEIVPRLPKDEQFDLVDQLRRCCKAAPALVAEGFAKRYQVRSWRKYLEDAMGECNEMIHQLSVSRDVYHRYVDVKRCDQLIEEYDLVNRQLYHLRQSWKDFHNRD